MLLANSNRDHSPLWVERCAKCYPPRRGDNLNGQCLHSDDTRLIGLHAHQVFDVSEDLAWGITDQVYYDTASWSSPSPQQPQYIPSEPETLEPTNLGRWPSQGLLDKFHPLLFQYLDRSTEVHLRHPELHWPGSLRWPLLLREIWNLQPGQHPVQPANSPIPLLRDHSLGHPLCQQLQEPAPPCSPDPFLHKEHEPVNLWRMQRTRG